MHGEISKKILQFGFTLVELLVVISIISLLSSIVLTSVNSARAKARDVRRRADLKQLQVALELYFDASGGYPGTTSWYGGGGYHDQTFIQNSGPNGWVPNLAPTYIPVLPADPRNLGLDTGYYYMSNGTDYKLLAFQTVEGICPVPASDAMYDPLRDNLSTAWGPRVPCTFAIYTPGGRGW